ncbi:protein of unknown function [Burkholderia multivorans]
MQQGRSRQDRRRAQGVHEELPEQPGRRLILAAPGNMPRTAPGDARHFCLGGPRAMDRLRQFAAFSSMMAEMRPIRAPDAPSGRPARRVEGRPGWQGDNTAGCAAG